MGLSFACAPVMPGNYYIPKSSRERDREEPKPQSEATASAEGGRTQLHYKENAQGAKVQAITPAGGLQLMYKIDNGETTNNAFAGNHLTLPGEYPWMDYRYDTLAIGWGADTKYLPDGSALNPDGYRVKLKVGYQQIKGETSRPLSEYGKDLDVTGTMGDVSLEKTDGKMNGLKLAVNYQGFKSKFNIGSKLGLIPGVIIPYTEKFSLTGDVLDINTNIPIAAEVDILAGNKTTTLDNVHKLPGQPVIPDFGHHAVEREWKLGAKKYLPGGTISAGSTVYTGTTMGSGVEGKIDPDKSIGFFADAKLYGSKPANDIKMGAAYTQLEAESDKKTFLSNAIIPLVGTNILGVFNEKTSRKNLKIYLN
ncbi:MAG: hypothetical protein ABIH39_05965, partial [Candidatus Margulisiibacteriota bacterium]